MSTAAATAGGNDMLAAGCPVGGFNFLRLDAQSLRLDAQSLGRSNDVVSTYSNDIVCYASLTG
ncbi:hypothetical protein F511_36352 [Dorcoceras hygrometricum]|uniref:Uncharacterized protein n=1 Tax=Dorcoceras hygrometricum TaxID=472368 RepID=A0A2Z7B4J4_9LAMI|nr:hypothetical protein F511_36352 [Dorcoceras hygrometricum]